MKLIEDTVSPFIIIEIRKDVLKILKTSDEKEQKLKKIEDLIETEVNQ
jgi:hypothetical protein